MLEPPPIVALRSRLRQYHGGFTEVYFVRTIAQERSISRYIAKRIPSKRVCIVQLLVHLLERGRWDQDPIAKLFGGIECRGGLISGSMKPFVRFGFTPEGWVARG